VQGFDSVLGQIWQEKLFWSPKEAISARKAGFGGILGLSQDLPASHYGQFAPKVKRTRCAGFNNCLNPRSGGKVRRTTFLP
jgi:hypothetical protein